MLFGLLENIELQYHEWPPGNIGSETEHSHHTQVLNNRLLISPVFHKTASLQLKTH